MPRVAARGHERHSCRESVPGCKLAERGSLHFLTALFTLKKEKTRHRGGDAMPVVIKPQPKQEEFLSNSADLIIYGGAAGGG